MSEFTEEQIVLREQWKIATDQFFREALFAVSQKVNAGIYDPYVLDVGKQMYKGFKDANMLGASNEAK
jgi:hypothetical protein